MTLWNIYRWNHTKILFQFIIIQLVKGDEIVQACGRHSNKTVTLGKHVTKYKYMRKWMIEVFGKSESRGNKISRINSN